MCVYTKWSTMSPVPPVDRGPIVIVFERSEDMNIGRTSLVMIAVLAAALAFPAIGRADDKQKRRAVRNAVVQFGAPQPQTPDGTAPPPGSLAGAVTHFLAPDDVRIRQGGTVTFVVNGGGHGIAIHPVSRNTTRADIAKDLCDGIENEGDRASRFTFCNGTIVTGVGTIVGTQNLAYEITDGREKLVIDVPQNVGNANPRVDDATHTHRLLATSGRVPVLGASPPPASDNPAGAFLVGTAPATPPATGFMPGNRIQVTFDKAGRYLVICMNRGHLLNDHMFGFVTVVDDDDDDRGHHDDEDNSGHN
jgi:plastocyanin